MCNKFYFTLRAALVLANASLASKEPAGASPNAEEGLEWTRTTAPFNA